MAYSVTDTGVEFSRGRGKAKVSIEISFKQLEKWAERQKIDTPKLMERSFGRACSGLKKRFYLVMKNAGGRDGVPKFKDFEAFTLDLRRVYGRTSPMGGALAERSNIVAYKRNGWQVVGWPDRLEKWSAKFQEGIGGPFSEDMFTDPKSRAKLHRKGITNVPAAYVHNERQIIPEPWGTFVESHLKEWANGAFYKELAKQMVKSGGVNL